MKGMSKMKLKAIYKPRGRAKEYSEYALTIYTGCDFGCKYCFVPNVLNLDRENFHEELLERDNFLENVEKDCIKLEGLKERVLLCFTCDPYNSLDLKTETTRKVLELFKKYNINFHILTKGGSRAKRDFDLYKPGDAFASTLTFVDDNKSKEWEPNAPLASDRIQTIKLAHSLGIETWVSLEPVVDPEESLKIIELTHEYVDLYKVGTLNYMELENEIDWKDFGTRAIALLEKYGKNYYIKNDLKKYL
jgi:DNA repair photolyase